MLGPEVAPVFADLHRDHGVDLRCGVAVADITGADGAVTGVRLTDGSRIAADLVLVGVGITPNSELAAAAGLEVDNGILVDEHLRTSDPTHLRRRRRRQRLPPAAAAGTSASSTGPTPDASRRPPPSPCSDRTPSYDRPPYFFTDQYDLGMEYTGYVGPPATTEVVFRGDADAARVHRLLAPTSNAS